MNTDNKEIKNQCTTSRKQGHLDMKHKVKKKKDIMMSKKYNLNKSSISKTFISSDLNALTGKFITNKDVQPTEKYVKLSHVNPSKNHFIEDKSKSNEIITNNPILLQNTTKDAKEQLFNINSMQSGAFKHRSKSLSKIPFSQVVGVQSKTQTKLSPFMNFSDLLESLTKSSKPVRMIPIGVTSASGEADYIRNQINRMKRES